MQREHDLIVVGGGPAGALLSTLVAQQGYRVILLEKNTFPVYKIGESLLPSIQPFLALAGLEDLLPKGNFTPKRGGTFRWGKETELFDFYFRDCGIQSNQVKAYQVRRQDFDYQLVKAAQANGVEVVESAKVLQAITDDTGRVTGVVYESEDKKKVNLSAKYVADASGHKSKLASQVGQRVFSKHYQNVSLFSYFENAEKLPGQAEGNTLFEAFEDGWCWYFPIDKNLFSVGVLIDKAAARKISKKGKLTTLHSFINKTTHVKKMMKGAIAATAPPYNQVHVRSDFSYCHSKFWQPGLVLLGDAAAFVDVLLSNGVHLATYSAVQTARSILSFFKGELNEADCFNEYEIRYKKEYGAFYKMLAGFYNQDKDSATYQQELRYWFARTSACGLPEIAKEKKEKLMQVLLGRTINNQENIEQIRTYIQQLLTCDNQHRVLNIFPDTPKIQTQFITTKNQLAWELAF